MFKTWNQNTYYHNSNCFFSVSYVIPKTKLRRQHLNLCFAPLPILQMMAELIPISPWKL